MKEGNPIEGRKAKPRPKVEEAAPADWEPVEDVAGPDRGKNAALALTFLGLVALLAYWQRSGLMAPAAAVPSMCVCCLLAGRYIGLNSRKEKNDG